MQKLSIIAVVAIVVAAFVLAGCTQQSPVPVSQAAPPGVAAAAQAPGSPTANASARVRLQDTRYANVAYLISDNATSPAEEAALAGFQVQRTVLPDGSMNVTLKALQPEYQDQSYVVQPGQQLYFIEASMGDDQNGQEYSLRDDTAVLTDSDGYIVNQ